MTDTKMEALRQALHYHNTTATPYHGAVGEKKPKPFTPEQVVATAKKFEGFLDASKTRR